MERRRPQAAGRVAECIAVGAACGFGLLNVASADPPPAARLDLRAPANFAATATPSASFRRSESDRRPLLPALGANDPRFRMVSRSAAFVDRARREGLAFARLWESRSALLSLGLNAQGKPGLWLTQKTR